MVPHFYSLEQVSILILFFFLAFIRICFTIETLIFNLFLQRQVDHVAPLHDGMKSMGHGQLCRVLLKTLFIHLLEKLEWVRRIYSSVEILPFLLRNGVFDLMHCLLWLHDNKWSNWLMALNLTIRHHYDFLPSFQAFDQAYFSKALASHDVFFTEIILRYILVLNFTPATISTLCLVNKCDFSHSEKVLIIFIHGFHLHIFEASLRSETIAVITISWRWYFNIFVYLLSVSM